MMLNRLNKGFTASARLAQSYQSPSMMLLAPVQFMNFTGKTEDGFKYRTPKLRLRKVKRVPAPGDNLKIPDDLDPETFCQQIGGDCDDIADKFETIDEIFTLDKVSPILLTTNLVVF